jgi:hypothetical protein
LRVKGETVAEIWLRPGHAGESYQDSSAPCGRHRYVRHRR